MKNQTLPAPDLLHDLRQIIESGQRKAYSQVNSTLVLVYWQIGKRLNEDVLQNERAAYGKEVIKKIAEQLSHQYGKSFQLRNLRRMMQFASLFLDFEIVSPLATQLTWTHFVVLLPLKSQDSRMYYAQRAIEERWSKRELTRQIERKSFERQEIAKTQLEGFESGIQNTFKDPYLLDFLDLQSGYSENNLEAAILRDLEQFILELGSGFTFVERQKRIILDGIDFYLDLLFFHRKLKRLVVIELKLDKFKPAFKGQMELYLRWLDKYEKEDGEESPIGLILCAEASREQVELLQMHKDGILVAEYLTELPPKKALEKRLQKAFKEGRERIAKKKLDA